MKEDTPGFDEYTNQPLPDAFSALSERLAQLNSDVARLLTQAFATENVSLSGLGRSAPPLRYSAPQRSGRLGNSSVLQPLLQIDQD
jgi:hypothetical protein